MGLEILFLGDFLLKDRSDVVSSKNNDNNIKKEHGLVNTFFSDCTFFTKSQ